MDTILKIEKSQYLQNCLAAFDKILHSDTYSSSRLDKLSNIQIFKNSKWLAAILKKLNALYSQLFDPF